MGDDPKEKGARYFKERQNISAESLFGDLPALIKQRSALTSEILNKRIDGFMWIEATEYETGGFGFTIYQLRDAGIDGRGTGWFHQGDFDDWSTESLQYRIYQDQLEIAFELRPEHSKTKFTLTTKEKKRYLSLQEDPRNFWHQRSFLEMGKSF